jgi:hypothetical protein
VCTGDETRHSLPIETYSRLEGWRLTEQSTQKSRCSSVLGLSMRSIPEMLEAIHEKSFPRDGECPTLNFVQVKKLESYRSACCN